ncbi:TetR/AcrR family transcriptional regulator [Spirillospora sp. CA-108201]
MSRHKGARERLVRAALAIMATDGVTAVTNRRLAAQAGLSPGSVTYHFPSQQDLVREGMRTFIAEETRRFAELADRVHQGNDLDQAGALAEQIASETGLGTDHTAWFELYIHASKEPELHALAAEFFGTYDRLAATVLRSLGVPDPEKAAPMTVALFIGTQLRRLATGNPTASGLADTLLPFISTLTGDERQGGNSSPRTAS